ncbi:MAG: DUF296 domain-containing protein [Rhodobacteraceae bacterium]|nr:DUF296 domain-containing protein [Paracoccaceae bacterium]
MIRTLDHPGPPTAERITALPCAATQLDLPLPAGVPLPDALARAAEAAGISAAWLELTDATMARLDHLRPGPDPSRQHAAWYDGPHAAPGASLIRLGLHLGRRNGAPWLHGHGIWAGPRGIGGGHVVPDGVVLAEPATARGWALDGARLEVAPDPETRFDLFQPVPTEAADAADAVLVTLRPNQDLTEALEAAAAAHGIDAGTLHGLGSLVAPRFLQGAEDSFATEILITEGWIEDGRAYLNAAVVGFGGRVSVAPLARGGCGVCVTCEVLIRRAGRAAT